MILEVCARLKQKRGERELSIEEVVERTKLHPSVIRDIEAGNFSNVNPTYLKGFIRIYASFLDVEIGSALEEINASLPGQATHKKKVHVKPISPPKPLRKKLPEVFPHVKKLAVFGLAVIVAVWALVAVSKFIARKVKHAAKEPVVAAPEPQAMPAVTEGEITVSLTAKRKCYVRASVDGQVLFEGVLAQNAVETWVADKELDFRISDGSALYIEVNGEAIPALTKLHRPIKSLKITPSGITVDK